MARASFEAAFRIDVRPILPTITAPTLVIHAREDPAVPVQCGRYLADHIPGARYLEVEGVDHAPWFTEPDRILTGIEEFLTGSHAAPAQSHRALRTVLFTDMVASTQHAAATGDERWRAVLQRFGEITADLTQRFGGTVVKSTGDGHLATFDGPTQAIRCAEALRADAETLGIEIRAGIHTGECELLDTDIGGIAVHIAARILGQAGAGEILVSRTVRDLVVGSGTGFEDRGSVELRGVPGTWQLLAVDRHGPRAGSAEAELASTPTPGPRTAMRRSDRAVAVMARRTPWILRGMARLAPATGRSSIRWARSAAKRPIKADSTNHGWNVDYPPAVTLSNWAHPRSGPSPRRTRRLPRTRRLRTHQLAMRCATASGRADPGTWNRPRAAVRVFGGLDSRSRHSWPIFMPGHRVIGRFATLDSSRVMWPENPGSMKPAVEWVNSPRRPSEDLPSSRRPGRRAASHLQRRAEHELARMQHERLTLGRLDQLVSSSC